MARAKSPLYVTGCKPWIFPLKPGERRRTIRCRWACRGGLKAAQFVDRRDPTWTVVLHPSTKRTGWQVSRFDRHGAVGDTIRPTCSEALEAADITPYRWKLVEVVR